MTQVASSSAAHFSGSGAQEFNFTRPFTSLLLTTSSSTTISFNNGVNFIGLADGTIQLNNLRTDHLKFGAGTYAGVGFSF